MEVVNFLLDHQSGLLRLNLILCNFVSVATVRGGVPSKSAMRGLEWDADMTATNATTHNAKEETTTTARRDAMP